MNQITNMRYIWSRRDHLSLFYRGIRLDFYQGTIPFSLICIGMDHIWLQYFLGQGPKYACNLGNKSDQICLQSSKFSFSRDTFRKHSHVTLYWKGLLAYMVRFGFDIATILGPHCNHDCKLIWSLLLPRLQAYLVPFLEIIATICGPSLYRAAKIACVYRWSIEPH